MPKTAVNGCTVASPLLLGNAFFAIGRKDWKPKLNPLALAQAVLTWRCAGVVTCNCKRL